MTRAEVLAILRPWHERTVELQRQWDAFAALTCAADDSPLADAIWRVHKEYTKAVADRVGDADDWLNWWHYECQLGRRPQNAHKKFGDDALSVSTLGRLATVICWGRPRDA